MIRYTLACDAGHRFDSWFADSSAFDQLAASDLVHCPTCGSARVAKTIMAPAIVAQRARPEPASLGQAGEASSATAPTQGAEAASPQAAMELFSLAEDRRRVRALVSAFREKVLAATQDVGRQFPDQARRMHEGDIPHREIRGEATVDEARALLEDGILVMPLPDLPEEWN